MIMISLTSCKVNKPTFTIAWNLCKVFIANNYDNFAHMLHSRDLMTATFNKILNKVSNKKLIKPRKYIFKPN